MIALVDSISDQTLTTALFYLFALLSAGSALGVAISRNIVRTAVFLLGALVGVGGLYFLLNAEFLAAVQLVVYAGGTLILIIFGVMLTSKSPFSRFEPKLGEVMIAISIGSVLLIALVMGILRTTFASQELNITTYPLVQLGQVLLGDYLIPFELASVLLLVVMIGAAYLAKGRREIPQRRERTEASETMRRWS